jgi:SpoVK/Ycf46/Vps4 family AAA+-type ATPase
MSDKSTSLNKTVILPYQKPIFDRLCRIARACLCVNRKDIQSLKLRTNFFLIGPSGTGKTFLARALAEEEMKVPYLSVSISDWLLIGNSNRGGTCTWSLIFEFLEKNINAQGVIIFIDEADKASHDTNYNSFLKTEVFSVCDYRVPLGLSDTDNDVIDPHRIERVEEFLKYKTMIIAGAAFQDIWENQSAPQIGFVLSENSITPPELRDLTKYLPRELINRFSSEIFVLPQPTKADYQIMIETMATEIPDIWRAKFLELGIARLDQALSNQKGARYPEEILLSAIVAVRGCMNNYIPIESEVTQELPDKLDDSLGIF